MKKLGCAVIVAVLLIAFLFTPYGRMIGGGIILSYKHGALKRRGDLPEIAEIMRAQLTDGDYNMIRSDDPEFPQIFKDLGARVLFRGPWFVEVGFGGGFYHYGYRLERRNSTSGSDLVLICTGEYPEDAEELLTIPWQEKQSSNKSE